jgi:hypothetical protein
VSQDKPRAMCPVAVGDQLSGSEPGQDSGLSDDGYLPTTCRWFDADLPLDELASLLS